MKVIRMNAPRTHILLPLLIVCCLPSESLRVQRQTISAQELLPVEEVSPDTEMDTQLRINKTALLENKNDKGRVDAAGLLLSSENPAARDILLEVLRRTDNPQARAAVCEALNPARVGQKPLRNKEDFVKPLIAILRSEEDPEIAKRAAEATLIFGYSQVQQDLEKAATDPSLSINVRMNIVYALKRHPDREAVAKLVTLLGSPDLQIVEAVRAALTSVGIPASQDPTIRRQMLADLRQHGVEAFLRERLVRQETRVRELETDLLAMQKRYLTALGDGFDSRANDAAKNAFLLQQLSSPEIVVRLWALDKLQELRNAKGTLKLPELELVLSALISDSSRQVRLKTARVLAKMGELNTSKPLLEQLKVEQDEQIKREMLVALGEACYAGSMPTAGRKVPEEIRREALEWAIKFLNEPDTEKVRSGAAVVSKLLEQEGLKQDDVDRYLKALSERYGLSIAGADPAMRAYLLGAMAGLCAARSTCREQAVKLYSGSFEQALSDKAEIVRLSAVDGCVNIDKVGALRKLRETMATDSSVAIRQKLIDLAGEVGGPQELEWLAAKMGVAGENETAWQAMQKIFRASDLTVLTEWAIKIDALAAAGKVAVEQRIAFSKLVEQKAQSENKADVLRNVQANLAQLYVASNNLKLASESLNALLRSATTEDEKQRLQSQLLGVYLRSASMDQASEIIYKYLSAKELASQTGLVVRSLEEYLNDPKTTDPGAVLGALQQIKVKDPETARAWQVSLSRWTERYAKAKKSDDSGRVNN